MRTVHVGMRSRADVRGALRAYRLWRLRPDVVFSHSLDAQAIGQAIAYRAGARHVTAEHAGSGLPRGRHRELVLRFLAPRIDVVACVSRTQRPELQRLGFRDAAIEVIPNGVPDVAPEKSSAAVRAELELARDDVVVLFVATLRPEKRPDLFVDAVVAARSRDARIRGVLAGGGPQLPSTREYSRAAGDAVRVLGERSDVRELMECADAVCLATSAEAAPMTLIEAMAAARPVIATDVGGIAELVLDGETGWLVPPDDVRSLAGAFVELAADPARARTMGQAGRARFEDGFTVDAMVDRYANLLSRLTGEGSATR